MKIDIGAGKHRKEGFLRVDLWDGNEPDIVADARQSIPGLDDGCAEEVHCWHVLEHLEHNDWKLVMLEIARLLQPTGRFEIRVPHPSFDDAMIHGHLWILTPWLWRCCRDDKWLGDHLIITEIHEVPNQDCVEFCKENYLDFNKWSKVLRNSFRETIVRGYKP